MNRISKNGQPLTDQEITAIANDFGTTVFRPEDTTMIENVPRTTGNRGRERGSEVNSPTGWNHH